MSKKNKKDMDKLKTGLASSPSRDKAKKKTSAKVKGSKTDIPVSGKVLNPAKKRATTGKSAQKTTKPEDTAKVKVKKVSKRISEKSIPEKQPAKSIRSRSIKAVSKSEDINKTAPVQAKTSVQRIVIEKALSKGLENLKERVEAAKFFTPMRAISEEHEINDLPKRYGVCRIVCLVRDPYWIHSYWEITEERLHDAEKYFGKDWGQTKTILRVHDITGINFDGKNSRSYFDIDITSGAESWYINVNSPNTAYVVEIARVSPGGKIFVLARSNYVTTPRDGMSDILDEEWMSLDFDKMYALSGGFRIGATSAEMSEMMRQRLKSDISSWGGSGAVSSFGGSPVAEKRRGFWFTLDCELIVYGATEPDAKVTMQGHPVNLRPDGTFTVRFALPDGTQEIETTATSSDGVEERTITPIVSRNTESESKILKEI